MNKDEPGAVINEPTPLQPVPSQESNHFEVTQPKDDLELIRSQSVSPPGAFACIYFGQKFTTKFIYNHLWFIKVSLIEIRRYKYLFEKTS